MLDNIQNNIAKLISMYEAQRQRADSLAAKLADTEAAIHGYKEQITELNQQIDNLRLMSAFQVYDDPKEAKARVDALIREIDRCIKLLES